MGRYRGETAMVGYISSVDIKIWGFWFFFCSILCYFLLNFPIYLGLYLHVWQSTVDICSISPVN